MAIRSQLAWHWRWALNLLMMAVVAGVVWWLVQNSYRITGFDFQEARQRIEALGAENARLRKDLDGARSSLVERERQLQVEKASQVELTRSVAQLQEENAALKEDLGFLRKLMSSGAAPEGLTVSDLKVERLGRSSEYRYRMLLTQGGQRKQDFRGRVQIAARVMQAGASNTIVFPDPARPETEGAFDFRFYHKVEGRFMVPEGSELKAVEMRILAVPGGQVKLSRTVNMP